MLTAAGALAAGSVWGWLLAPRLVPAAHGPAAFLLVVGAAALALESGVLAGEPAATAVVAGILAGGAAHALALLSLVRRARR